VTSGPIQKVTLMGEPKIKYMERCFSNYTFLLDEVERSGGILNLMPGQEEDGYGTKITTDYKVRIQGYGTYRIYATCVSNCASHWIKVSGRVYHIFTDDIRGSIPKTD